jgi:hypothetical protein
MYDYERFPDGRAVVFDAGTGSAYCVARDEAHARTICATLDRSAPVAGPAGLTLEPLTAAPHTDGSRVILDARNVDHWSRNHGR